MSHVTDITHFNGVLSPRSRAPEAAKKIARFMGSIVQAGTAWLPDTVLGSAIHCRRRPNGKTCPGRITLIRAAYEKDGEPTTDPRIMWACPVCKDDGIIRNWADTEWDMSDVERDPDWWDSETVEVNLSEAEYLALREELAENKKLFVFIILATGEESGPVMEITKSEVMLMVEGVFQSMKRASGRRKSVMESVMDKLHSATFPSNFSIQ